MIRRGVKKVTVEFSDGEKKTFHVNGFYKKTMNNVPRELRLEQRWEEHEIRWNTKPLTE